MEFREMRRKRQLLSEAESISILQKATSGTLALMGDGGYPYAVPISYVYDDSKLYFHSAMSGHKVDAIRGYDKASFCVIDQDDVKPAEYTTCFRSVIAFGRIHIVEDEKEKLATPESSATDIIRIRKKPCRRNWSMAFLVCWLSISISNI